MYLNVAHFFLDFLYPVAIVFIPLNTYSIYEIRFPELIIIIFLRIILYWDFFGTMDTVELKVPFFVQILKRCEYWGLELSYFVVKFNFLKFWFLFSLSVFLFHLPLSLHKTLFIYFNFIKGIIQIYSFILWKMASIRFDLISNVKTESLFFYFWVFWAFSLVELK